MNKSTQFREEWIKWYETRPDPTPQLVDTETVKTLSKMFKYFCTNNGLIKINLTATSLVDVYNLAHENNHSCALCDVYYYNIVNPMTFETVKKFVLVLGEL